MKEFSYEKIVKDPAVFQDNRLKAHSDHVAYRSMDELTSGETTLRMSLDGLWKWVTAAAALGVSALWFFLWRRKAEI